MARKVLCTVHLLIVPQLGLGSTVCFPGDLQRAGLLSKVARFTVPSPGVFG